MHKLTLVVLATGAAIAANAQVTLAYWTFDNYTQNTNTSNLGLINTTPTGVDPAIGGVVFTTNAEGGVNTNSSGTPTGSVGGFGGTTVNDPRITPSATGALTIIGGLSGTQPNNGANITYEITSVTGTTLDLSSLSFAFRGSSTGFANNQVSYSIDGVNYTNVGPTFAGNSTSFAATSLDLSSVAELQGVTDVYLRWTFNGATSNNGNTRLDNIVLTGTSAPVPEPASMLALGIGAAALLRRRRSKK